MKQITRDQLNAALDRERAPRDSPRESEFSEAAKNVERARLHAHLSSKKPVLSPAQLCHLLNYALGLPVVIGKRTILATAIPVIVVKTWTGWTRRRAENWIEQELRRMHLLPKVWHELHGGGRPVGLPRELAVWVPGRRAA